MEDTAVQANHSKAVSRRRRRWPWVLLALLVVGGVWFGRFAYLRVTLRPAPRIEYWNAELARLFPAPPDALPMSQIDAALTSRPFELDPQITSLPSTATQPYDVSDCFRRRWDSPRPEVMATRAVLAGQEFAEACRILEDALSRPWHFPPSSDPMNVHPSYHLMEDARQWARWLVVHSYWAAGQGQTGAAVRDWRLVFQLAGQLRRQPATIPHLVAMAIEELAAQEMTEAAREGIGSADLHRLTAQIDASLPPGDAVQKIIAAERISVLCWLEHVYVPEPAGWLDVSGFAGMVSQSNSWAAAPPASPSRLWNLTSPLFHDLSTARRNVTRHFESYQACRDLISSARVSETEAARTDGPTVLDGVPGLFSPARASASHFQSVTCIEGALASLGLAEYRRAHGRYPDSLEDLVPAILPRVPIDYAGGKPLRYRRSGDDYVLYSIWSNGIDDGGVDEPDDRDPPDKVFSNLRRKLGP